MMSSLSRERCVATHTDDASASLDLVHEVAVVGIAGDDADRARLTRARHVHDLIVGDGMGQIETAGGVASDIGVAIDARLTSGDVGGFKNLTLDARERGLQIGRWSAECRELLITPRGGHTHDDEKHGPGCTHRCPHRFENLRPQEQTQGRRKAWFALAHERSR